MRLTKNNTEDELIQSVINLVRQLKQTHAKNSDHPFSFVQMQLLWYLSDLKDESQESPTMSELALFLKVKAATCSQLIERLVEADFVRREADKKDRRVIRVILTSKGVKELSKMKEERLTKLKKLLSSLSQEETKVLMKVIDKIRSGLP